MSFISEDVHSDFHTCFWTTDLGVSDTDRGGDREGDRYWVRDEDKEGDRYWVREGIGTGSGMGSGMGTGRTGTDETVDDGLDGFYVGDVDLWSKNMASSCFG